MHKWSFGFLIVALLHLGSSAPLGAAEVPKNAGSVQRPPASSKQFPVMTVQSVGDGLVKMITKPKAQSSKVTPKGVVRPNPASSKKASVRPPAKGVKPGYVPPPPKAGEPQIRQEIQKILDLDKKIKSLQTNRSAQLQRIQEQARIHQKILGELEASKKKTAVQKPLDKDVLLAQEKIRIIHEETQRNTKMVDDIQKKSSGASVKEIAKAKPPAA